MLLGRTKARQKAKGKRQQEAALDQPPRSSFLFPFAFFLLPWLLAAISLDQAEDLVRRGNTAFAGADFATAIDFYSRAEESVTDPGLVAFNKAAALYHLGRYREAELYYRYGRDEATGLRRARLLYSLGNCLLQQAQDRDTRRLKEAMSFYEACMQYE